MRDLTSEQQAFIDTYRERTAAALEHETAELIQYCTLKSKFAAHYREKDKQFRETNDEMCRRAAAGQTGPGVTPEVVEEMVRVGTELHDARMRRLADHFQTTWGEPIDTLRG